MKLWVALFAAVPLWSFAETTPAPAAPEAVSGPLGALDFLLGDWRSTTPGSGRADQFAYALGRKVITRTVPGNAPGAAPHSVMTVWPDADGSSLQAIYFDDQGHVIHYRSQLIEPHQRVQFLSDAAEPGPRLRLTYQRQGAMLHAKFEMAAPGQADSYRVVAEGDEIAATP